LKFIRPSMDNLSSSNIGQLSTDVSVMKISIYLSVDLGPNRTAW